MAERSVSQISIFLILLFSPSFLSAMVDADSVKSSADSSRRIGILPVPAFGYSPETSTYVGAVALFTFHLYDDSITRTSNAKAEFNYTWKKQYITDLGWEYYTRRERYYLKGRLTLSRYPDVYYGIGEDTPDSNEQHFDSRRVVFEGNVLKSLGKSRFLGLCLRYNNYFIPDEDSIRNHFQEISSRSNLGAGLRFMSDKRNNLLNATVGRFSDYSLSVNTSAGKIYYKMTVDLRSYRTFREKHTLALRCLGLFTVNEAPFYDLALLGGDSQVRGYLYGRYRDNNLLSVQSEYRSLIYRRWGYALFGGISKVNHSLEKVDLQYLKYNYGAGIRFMIDRKEKTNLRLDYALGDDGSQGFYISFGEAF